MRTLLILCLLSLFISCDNEAVEVETTGELIPVNSELFTSLEAIAQDPVSNGIGCIDFVYSFSIFLYDTEQNIVGLESISSDQDFLMLLNTLAEGQSISLSYPITSTLIDGTAFSINSNEELRDAIASCVDEEQEAFLAYCNGLLEQCVWTVDRNEQGTEADNQYIDSSFEIFGDGVVQFTFEDQQILGTWVTYYIGFEPHLNINLNDPNDEGLYWNHD